MDHLEHARVWRRVSDQLIDLRQQAIKRVDATDAAAFHHLACFSDAVSRAYIECAAESAGATIPSKGTS